MSFESISRPATLINASRIEGAFLNKVSALNSQRVGSFCGHTVAEVEPTNGRRAALEEMLKGNVIPRLQAAEIEHIIIKLLTDVGVARGGFQKFIGTSEFQNLPEEDKKILQKDGASFATIKTQLEATQARAKSIREYVPSSGNKLNLAEEIEEITATVQAIPTEFVEAQQVLTADLTKYGLLALFQQCCRSSLQSQQQLHLQQQQQQTTITSAFTASTGGAAPSSKAPANTPLATVVAGREKAGQAAAEQRSTTQREALIHDQQKAAVAEKTKQLFASKERAQAKAEAGA